MEKNFMWIFDYKNFQAKDIVELSDFDINIDEETNAKTIVKIMKKTDAKARDIVAIKINNEVVYWGIVSEIQNNNDNLYTFVLKYITNIFNREIRLLNENIIKENGVEDFIASTIELFFTKNSDTFTNITYLETDVQTHTPKQTSVTNVENGIYNFHTWATNCTQYYNVIYNFFIIEKKFIIQIKKENINKELIDTKAQLISNYTEVFETDVTAKVIVSYRKVNGIENPGVYVLYLRRDRTTTTDMNDPDRVEGTITTIYTEDFEDANQAALDVMKANSYNHNITFNYNKYLKAGTPIAIKTKDSAIFDTYISSIKITKELLYEYMCGNIRINFIDKLLKERGK